MLVDAHAHVSSDWYEPVETLLAQMQRHGVERAVLTQLIGQVDNHYQLSCTRRHAGRFASVVWIDAAAEDASQTLARLAEEGAAGVRLRPTAALNVWQAALDCRLPVSCVGTAEGFAAPAFAALLKALPGLTVVLEHLGGSSQPPTTPAELELRHAMLASLSRFDGVCLKLPGLGELLTRPPSGKPFGVSTLLEAALKSFGPDRLMWGSDFPVVSSREGYGNALKLVRECLADQPLAAQEAVFGGTARRIFWKE